MDGQEQIERRNNYAGEKRRMDDMLLKGFIDLSNKISSMEATQKELIEAVHKANNHNQRIVSLEEYRERQIATCVKIQEDKEKRRFPWNAVIVGVIVAFATSIINYFANK